MRRQIMISGTPSWNSQPGARGK